MNVASYSNIIDLKPAYYVVSKDFIFKKSVQGTSCVVKNEEI